MGSDETMWDRDYSTWKPRESLRLIIIFPTNFCQKISFRRISESQRE